MGVIASYRKNAKNAADLWKLARLKPRRTDRYLLPTITRRAKQLGSEELRAAAERYLGGETVQALAHEFGVHRTTLSDRLASAGIAMRVTEIRADEIDVAVEAYEAGQSLAAIGKELGYSANTVRTALRRRDAQIRPRPGGRAS